MEVKENKISNAIVEVSRLLRDSEGRPIALKLMRGITSKRQTTIGIPKLSKSAYETFQKIYDSSSDGHGLFEIVYFQKTFVLHSIKAIVHEKRPSHWHILVTPKSKSFTLGQTIDYLQKKSHEQKSLCFVTLEGEEWKILSSDKNVVYIDGLKRSLVISVLYALDNVSLVKENETITKESFLLGLENPTSFYICVK